MKLKIKKKYDEYKTREGTKTIGDSMTDDSQRMECDIYACLDKYGATTLINQTQAKEFLYLDNTNRDMTLDEAVRIDNYMREYFDELPARVRKQFGDKAEVFIEKYKRGEFNDFISTGVLSEQMVNELELNRKEVTNEQMGKGIVSNESISTDSSQSDNRLVERNN